MRPFWKLKVSKYTTNLPNRKLIFTRKRKMFTQDDVNILRNQLPTSAVMEIFKRTKISRPTIYRFLNGERIRYRLQLKIYSTALKIIERDKIRTGKIKQERSRILNTDFEGE